MATITIDLNKQVKRMKPMHGGGQPPVGGKDMTEYFHYMTEAGIPFLAFTMSAGRLEAADLWIYQIFS